MPNLIPPPLFADAGAVVGLLVLVFTVVGWLVNLANSQNNPQAAPPNRPRPPRPKGQRVKSEIDMFLQEVRGQKIPQEDVVLEALPPEPPRRHSRPSPPPLPESPRPTTRGRLSSFTTQVQSHVGETLASHHLASNVGERKRSWTSTIPAPPVKWWPCPHWEVPPKNPRPFPSSTCFEIAKAFSRRFW